MSSAVEESRRRREALEAMKARRTGGVTSIGFSDTTTRPTASPNRSPERVLVPASSPAGPSMQSKYFSGASAAIPQIGAGGVIPSSNINRTNGTFTPSGSAGSPTAVMASMLSRRNEDTGPSTVARGSGSLSYEGTSTAASNTLVDSPSSPQPLSRLKSKYADDTPTRPSPSSSQLGHSQSTPIRSPLPLLVQAAQEQHALTEAQNRAIAQLRARFPLIRPDRIYQIIRAHPGDISGAMVEAEELARREGILGHSIRPPGQPGKMKPRPLGSSPSAGQPIFQQYQPGAHRPVPVPVVNRVSPAKPPKTKKNEKSAIYANRTNGKFKRRDPDESESDALGSEAESEVDWSGDEGPKRKKRRGEADIDPEGASLKAFNEVTPEELTGTIACSADQAAKIVSLRPFADADELRAKLNKARGVSAKLFEQYVEIMEGYVQIDACLNKCESIASDVANTLAVWRGASHTSDSVVGTPRSDGLNDVKVDITKVDELLRNEVDPRRRKILNSYIKQQPATLSKGTVLKDYQLLGVNWLNLLWSKKIGCILADEMGLGKTIQVIAFLAALKERGMKGPHMIFVPASTLENWIREFERFAPGIDVQSYYGSQAERAELRDDLKRRFRAGKLEVVLASYTQVASYDDLSFFRKKIEFQICVYDEGHKLKSCTTKAYSDLMSIQPRWRLLLTGTPLQNNLQELVSLLMFIHKDTFADAEPYLRAIFKSQGQANLLSQQRTSRARTMLTPFVLRRRKAHVLQLPPKIEKIEHCEMTKVQAKLYQETMKRSRKVLEEMDDDALEQQAAVDEAEGAGGKKATGPKGGKKGKSGTATPTEKKSLLSSSSHILMDLRKAASHPLLFRRLYTNAKIRQIAKACLNTPKWCDSNYDYVVEDLEIMSDAELHRFCTLSEFDELQKFALKPESFLEGGKVEALRRHIERCKAEGKRMLLFSQFVMILDILEVALDHMGIQFTRLDGSTKTDERQGLVDQFNDDPDITVFLLSTKAGGVGINLTAASVVVIYDQDFNPHNDRQAADRAYRIGQEKEVEVIKLITKGSIDEDMLTIGEHKLRLDDAVGGDEIALDSTAGEGKDDKTAKEMRKSLLTTLRNKFESAPSKQANGGELASLKEEGGIDDSVSEAGEGEEKKPIVKVARASIANIKDSQVEVEETL